MKAGLFSIAALSAVAAAQPRHQRHQHKRQAVETDVVTQVDYVTATAPDVMIYVDEDGNPLYTSYAGQAASSPTQAAAAYSAPPSYAAPSSESSSYVAPAPTTSSIYTPPPAPTSTSEESSYVAPAPATTEAPSSYSAPETTSSAPASSSSSSSSSGSDGAAGHGLSYSPYAADGSCKTQDQVNTDFEQLSGYSMIRTYGTDCDQVSTVLSAASAKGMKLFAGVYDITQVDSEVQTIIDAAGGNWDAFHTVSVGNEGVNAGTYTVDAVVGAIDAARTKLRSAGYNGPVVTVDTFVAIKANPTLCEKSDYAAANAHAFFDGGVTADQAGKWLISQAQQVSAACGNKDTMITETGWPSQGETNDKAVPSPENQQAAIDSIKSHFSSNVILFTAYNDLWKQNNAATFGAEQYWGIYGNCPSSG